MIQQYLCKDGKIFLITLFWGLVYIYLQDSPQNKIVSNNIRSVMCSDMQYVIFILCFKILMFAFMSIVYSPNVYFVKLFYFDYTGTLQSMWKYMRFLLDLIKQKLRKKSSQKK